MTEADLKARVRSYWDAHPCGTQFTDGPWGTAEFFAAVRDERYLRQPFMAEAVGFSRYPGKDLLEIGCGLGTDLREFARGGARVTGLDLTPAGVGLARKRFALEGVPGRFLVGDDNRKLIPFSAILGAALVIYADLFARVVVAPTEIPLGIVTAAVGAPFLLYLVRSKT